MKSSFTTSVRNPKNQGGHGPSDATTQKTKIQPKSGPAATGKSTQVYTVQPSGTKGTNPGAK